MHDATGKRPCSVVLAGWYGAANFGDELLLASIIEWVRTANGTPIVISVHPDYTRSALDAEAVSYVDLASIVEAMSGADLFVLGGGGLFQDYDALDVASLRRFPARNATQYAQYLHLAAEIGLPTLALAQGVGPLRSAAARTVTADTFRRAGALSVRDRESATLLRELGIMRPVPVAPDPVWTRIAGFPEIDLRSRFPRLAGKRILGVNLRDWPFDKDWEDAFVAAFRHAVSNEWACVWVDFQRTPAADGAGFTSDEIAQRMISRLGDATMHLRFDGASVVDSCAALAGCDAVLAMRLHGVLIGHGAGRPVVALEYDGKVRALGDELGVPQLQRLSLADIASQLPGALHSITDENAKPFTLAHSRCSQFAAQALIHRQLLWDEMAHSHERRKRPDQETPHLLPDWLRDDPAAAPRVLAALARPGDGHLCDVAD